MSSLNRLASENWMEELVKENENMLLELDELRPLQARVEELLRQHELDSAELTALRSDLAAAKAELLITRQHLNDHKESANSTLTDLKHHATSSSDQLNKMFLMLRELRDSFSNSAVASSAAMVDQRRRGDEQAAEIVQLKQDLATMQQQRDEAITKAEQIQGLWSEARGQANQLSAEQIALRSQAAKMLSSLDTINAPALAELVSKIFDTHESDVAEMRTNIAILQMQLADQSQSAKEQIQSLRQSKEELSSRLMNALGLLGARRDNTDDFDDDNADHAAVLRPPRGSREPSSSSLSTSTAYHYAPDAEAPRTTNRNNTEATTSSSPSPSLNASPSFHSARRMTLSRDSGGNLSARISGASPPPPPVPTAAAVATTPPTAINSSRGGGATGRLVPPPPPLVAPSVPTAVAAAGTVVSGNGFSPMKVKCPRCTYDNPREARRCNVCDLPLRAPSTSASSLSAQ